MADAWATTLIVAGGKRAETLARANGLGAFVVTGTNSVQVGFPMQ